TRLDALGQQHADVVLLQTVPGLGPRTAETVAAYLHDAPRFRSAKQVSAYSGLVPRQHQSGEMDRRGRITKRGPALLRKMLVECAWCMVRYNAWARGLYLRLTGGGQRRKKQAIVALARKILVRSWAMLRDKKPWSDPQTRPKQALPPSKQRRQAKAKRLGRKGSGRPARRPTRRTSVSKISPHRAATRGLIAAPWTPASHLLCCRGESGWLTFPGPRFSASGDSKACVTDWKNMPTV